MFRRRRRAERSGAAASPALSDLAGEWRQAVGEAMASRERMTALLARTPEGPLRDRLAHLASTIDAGVVATTRAATRAQAIETTVAEMTIERLTAELKDARRRLDSTPEADPERGVLEAMAASLAAQHASANRLANELDGVRRGLRLLDLRLDATVARAAELALRPASDLDLIGRELDDAARELDALRTALDELDAPTG